MFGFSSWWRTAATAVALASAASAAPALTTIQDVLYKADGSRFNGTVTITWTSFLGGDGTQVPSQAITVEVVNGAFKVRLMPTTNASAGASYFVQYSSQGKFQFSETWAVPPSSATLRIRDIRVGTGTVVGPPPGVQTEIAISDVTGLTSELGARPMRGAGFALARAAVINSAGMVDGATGNLNDCIHVDGSSGPCGSGGSSLSTAFADGETPTGLVNGVNPMFGLNFAPSPASSLTVFRNGILMKQGGDYLLSGSTITFYTGAVPQTGDLMTVWYRYSSQTQTTLGAQFADGETPLGPVNGTNATYTLSYAPSPAASLVLFRNGVLMKQGADYTLSYATVTFYSAAVPQPGDLLTAYYRH